MKIDFYNCPPPQEFNNALLKDASVFLSYQPNFDEIKKIAEEYSQVKNVIVIGHGGSVTTLYGLYNALKYQATKNLFFVSTVDPDYIAEIKANAGKEDTLVIAISKSGENVTQIEATMQFRDYQMLVITGSMGPLAEIAEKLGARTVLHPPIYGRFAGFTEVGLLPAEICGLDVESIFAGVQTWYKRYSENNEAYEAATVLQQLEEKGIVDVFMPIYDAHLYHLSSLIIQLCHESFGKDGEGQTYFAHHAPESQHHTNQRFFGGRKNIAGWFMSADKPQTDSVTSIPDPIKQSTLRSNTVGILDEIPLSVSLRSELDGTLEDAKLNNIPVILQTITARTPAEVGGLIAFWQLYAVYGSLLRNVDPFNQPQVENSKKISFDKRLQYKGLL